MTFLYLNLGMALIRFHSSLQPPMPSSVSWLNEWCKRGRAGVNQHLFRGLAKDTEKQGGTSNRKREKKRGYMKKERRREKEKR